MKLAVAAAKFKKPVKLAVAVTQQKQLQYYKT
jgi:hypothetical protein